LSYLKTSYREHVALKHTMFESALYAVSFSGQKLFENPNKYQYAW